MWRTATVIVVVIVMIGVGHARPCVVLVVDRLCHCVRSPAATLHPAMQLQIERGQYQQGKQR